MFSQTMFLPRASFTSSTLRPTSLYDTLSIPPSSTQAQIKAAFRAEARRWHPDACRRADQKEDFSRRFIMVREAYDVLSDPETRERYDWGMGRIGEGEFGRRKKRREEEEEGFGDWEVQLQGLMRKSNMKIRSRDRTFVRVGVSSR